MMSGYTITIPYELADEIVVKELEAAIQGLTQDIEFLESKELETLADFQRQDLDDHRRFLAAMQVVRSYYTVNG